ncbi:MAG: hypothetical protein J2P17_11710 [Mycobacterium sp.]|nr:hypothetical protein [Mycobacterium sp.]
MARSIAAQAAELAREWACQARGAGVSWSQLAAPLGVPVDGLPARSVEGHAFTAVAGMPTKQTEYASVEWTCGNCDQTVIDYGSWAGSPAEVEHGHAGDCERHRDDVRRHRSC